MTILLPREGRLSDKREDRSGCAPCKGGAFQWVRIPPGECSSR